MRKENTDQSTCLTPAVLPQPQHILQWWLTGTQIEAGTTIQHSFFIFFWMVLVGHQIKSASFPRVAKYRLYRLYNYIIYIIKFYIIYEDGPRAGTPLCFNKGNTRHMKQLLKHHVSCLRLGRLAPKLGILLITAGLVIELVELEGGKQGNLLSMPGIPAKLNFLRNQFIIWIIIRPILGLCCSMMLVALLPARVSTTVFGEHGPRYMLCSLAYRRNHVKSSTLSMPLVDVMPST